jgi:two-component system phosphate regulon sensor histidine kinase PhoR
VHTRSDFNTPIASIKITAEALKAYKHSPETQKEYFNMISYQSNRLENLTSQILENSRNIKNNAIRWTDVNLNELVTVAINDLKPQTESTEATIDYKPSKVMPNVQGETSCLCNVVVNLIENALNMPQEGHRSPLR